MKMKKRIRPIRDILFLMIGLFITSCADGYDNDFAFSSDVKGATLESPKAEDVMFTPNVDGSTVTVSWPVVHGSGGYRFSLYIVDDPENPVAVGEEGELVDGCSVKRNLLEDTNYKVVIRTLGNTKYDNKSAVDSTEATYSTLLAATVIPNGSDLTEYFANNPIPDTEEEQGYELVPGGSYTMSGIVDFGLHKITFRGNKLNRPTITYGADARITTMAGLKIKFINFDCTAVPASAGDASFLMLNKSADSSIKGTGDYYIINDPVAIQSCNFKGINRYFIYDNGTKYCVRAFLVKNCIVELNSSDRSIYMKGGFINDLTIGQSTFYNLLKSSSYFIQYNTSGRPDRAGFVTGSFNISNNTFYNVVYNGKMGNYSSMNKDYVSLNVIKNLFVDCSSAYVIRRLSPGSNVIKTLKDNCYWYNGAFPEATEINDSNGDKSNTGYGEDPAFVDAANADFTIGTSATNIVSKGTGDPRWLPAAK